MDELYYFYCVLPLEDVIIVIILLFFFYLVHQSAETATAQKQERCKNGKGKNNL